MLNNEQQALLDLKSEVENMMQNVISQLEKSQEAMINADIELSREIISIEKRINSTELKIDKACENILALYQPVATDLRLVLSVLSISKQLERIGDHAEDMADYIIQGQINKPFSNSILKKVKFNEMFEMAMSMIDDATYGFINEDTKIIKWVFSKEFTLNKINKESAETIAELIKAKPESANKLLYLFSIIKKLERIGDLAKNIAEETVFYIDAKIIKHRKNKQKKSS